MKYNLIQAVEFDKYAVKSYNAIYDTDVKQTDIRTVERLQKCDNYGNRLIKNQRIRKLTPLEYWRLQGFDDESFYKAQAVNSNSQLYKQSGNSITVDVLVEIYKQLKKYYPNDFIENIDIITLFSGIGAFESAFNKL